MLNTKQKEKVIKEFATHKKDTGSPEAVSYTHLDVYKRQLQDMKLFLRFVLVELRLLILQF